MPFPLIPLLIASMAGGAASSIGNNKAASKRQKDQGLQDVALAESGMDPYRQQLDQGNAINALDYLQNWQPLQAPEEMQPFVPTGGYEPSADVRGAAGALKRSVMSGRTAPTMTDPRNYGQTAAMNVLPGGGPAPTGISYNHLIEQQQPQMGAGPTADLMRRRLRAKFQAPPQPMLA